jgi:Bacterial Ig domain
MGGPSSRRWVRGLAGVTAAVAVLSASSAAAIPKVRIAILQPRAGAVVAGTVSVAVQVQPATGITAVGLRVDGKPVGAASGRRGVYRLAWNSTHSGNGRHVLTAAARAGGRLVVSAARPVSVRNPGPAAVASEYPVHTDITATVFWVGEPKGNGSSENNALSAYDDDWERHYGGYDDYQVVRKPPTYANGLGFTPAENPFYLDLPYDDVNDRTAFADRCRVVPWASQYPASDCRNGAFSYMKNRWVKLWRTVGGTTYTAYGQIEDAGPYVYDDEAYVFGTGDPRPASTLANNAGLDVSPALRDYLHFTGVDLSDQQNGDSNKVSWQFVDDAQVPAGPWKTTVTTRQVYQP